MGYSRQIFPTKAPSKEELTADMAGIGMRFHAIANHEANIEDTLFFASLDGMERNDLRTLSVLVRWLQDHSRWILADRLIQLVCASASPRVRAFWTSMAIWKKSDTRFARLRRLYQDSKIDLLDQGMDFFIERHGESEVFKDGPLRVPANVLRDRAIDVAPIEEIQKRHRALHFRVLIGPGFRADMWSMLERDPELTAYELARRTYGSFATAWQVKRDWKIIHGTH
jgi:hypothetical protein